MKHIMAIDPGAGGGIAWTGIGGFAHAEAMPEGMTGIIDGLREIVAEDHIEEAVMEKVGGYMPGDSATGAVKFARHCGWLEAGLYALGVPVRQVPPAVWMRSVFGSSLPKEKAERKRYIKEEMQRRFPHLKVTLKTADALGILCWAMEKKGV